MYLENVRKLRRKVKILRNLIDNKDRKHINILLDRHKNEKKT